MALTEWFNAATTGDLPALQAHFNSTPSEDRKTNAAQTAVEAAKAGQIDAVMLLLSLVEPMWLVWDLGLICDQLLAHVMPVVPPPPDGMAIFDAPDVLRLLARVEHLYRRAYSPCPANHAARQGHRRLRWFLENKTSFVPGLHAAATGDTSLLLCPNLDGVAAGQVAAAHGQIPVLEKLHMHGLLQLEDDSLAEEAASCGQVDVLSWLSQQSPSCVWGFATAFAAVQPRSEFLGPPIDKLPVVQFLACQRPDIVLHPAIMECAVLAATDEVLHWLLSQPTAGRSTVPESASDGRLLWVASKGWHLTGSGHSRLHNVLERRHAVYSAMAVMLRDRQESVTLTSLPPQLIWRILDEAGIRCSYIDKLPTCQVFQAGSRCALSKSLNRRGNSRRNWLGGLMRCFRQ